MRCPTKEGGSTKSIFAEILSEIYVEGSLHDLKNIVKIMYHYFHTRNRQVELIVTKSTPAVIKKKDNRIVKEKLSLSTEILIRDKFNGSLVKMLCPDRETLKAHSNCLLTLMMEVIHVVSRVRVSCFIVDVIELIDCVTNVCFCMCMFFIECGVQARFQQ